MALPHPAIRRAISIPVVLIVTVVSLILTPLMVIVLGLIDLATGYRHGRKVRVWLLVVGVLATETGGTIACLALSVFFVGRRKSAGWMAANYRLEYWWCRTHSNNIERWGRVRIVFDNLDTFGIGRSIVAGRHASHVDALVPLLGIARNDGALARYTLKEDLQWLPAMDLVGNRTPNVWIDRTPAPGSPMLTRVEALAAAMDRNDAAVIFPEGTFYTPARHRKAVARLARTQPELESLARSLRHMLPPRPAGFLALLRGAPDADVVLFTNVGLESGGDIAQILDNIAVLQTIRVRAWHHRRDTIPTDEAAATKWLMQRWVEMDEWIEAQLHATAAPAESSP